MRERRSPRHWDVFAGTSGRAQARGRWACGHAGAGGPGDVCVYASGSRHRERLGIPGLVDMPELLGIGSWGCTGPADIEMCGFARQLAVAGSPIRVWQGGKGAAAWEMRGVRLIR